MITDGMDVVRSLFRALNAGDAGNVDLAVTVEATLQTLGKVPEFQR